METQSSISCVIHNLLQLKPATWCWWRSIRAVLCVGMPFALGLMSANIMPWMWIAMGTLMMTTGERSSINYSSRALGLLCTAFLGAMGYFFGYLSYLPYGFTVVVMIFVGCVASVLSSRGANWSIGCLQLLLTASIAIGVPSISSFWWPAFLYLVGAVSYIVLLAVEAFFVKCSSKSENSHHTKRSYQVSNVLVLSLSLGMAYASHYVVQDEHWFWIPLTVGLIVKPELGNIFERSILRSLGTIVGVMLASLLLSIMPKNIMLALTISVLAGALPWCMARSYALQAVVLTPLVLLLVDSIGSGLQNSNYSEQRLTDTVIGAIIVIFVGNIIFRLERVLKRL